MELPTSNVSQRGDETCPTAQEDLRRHRAKEPWRRFLEVYRQGATSKGVQRNGRGGLRRRPHDASDKAKQMKEKEAKEKLRRS